MNETLDQVGSRASKVVEKNEVEFIERFGLLFEEDGLPRIAGRVFALLILSEEALTLDEMADILQVSKTSVSTNTRMLDAMQLLERTSKPGDRKVYYRLDQDGLEISYSRTFERMNLVYSLLEGVTKHVPGEKERVLERIDRLKEWHQFLLEEMESIWDRWQAREDRREK